MEVLYACEPIYGINHVIYIIYTYARWRIHIYIYSCVDASMNQSTYLCDLCVNISILLSVKFIPVHPGVIYLITYFVVLLFIHRECLNIQRTIISLDMLPWRHKYLLIFSKIICVEYTWYYNMHRVS